MPAESENYIGIVHPAMAEEIRRLNETRRTEMEGTSITIPNYDPNISWSISGNPNEWHNAVQVSVPETQLQGRNPPPGMMIIDEFPNQIRWYAQEPFFDPFSTACTYINPETEKKTKAAVEHARKIKAALIVHTTDEKLRIVRKYAFPQAQIYTPADLRDDKVALEFKRKWSGFIVDQVDCVLQIWLGIPIQGMTLGMQSK